jgi:hypothetical protein
MMKPTECMGLPGSSCHINFLGITAGHGIGWCLHQETELFLHEPDVSIQKLRMPVLNERSSQSLLSSKKWEGFVHIDFLIRYLRNEYLVLKSRHVEPGLSLR